MSKTTSHFHCTDVLPPNCSKKVTLSLLMVAGAFSLELHWTFSFVFWSGFCCGTCVTLYKWRTDGNHFFFSYPQCCDCPAVVERSWEECLRAQRSVSNRMSRSKSPVCLHFVCSSSCSICGVAALLFATSDCEHSLFCRPSLPSAKDLTGSPFYAAERLPKHVCVRNYSSLSTGFSPSRLNFLTLHFFQPTSVFFFKD